MDENPIMGLKMCTKSAPRAKLQGITPALSCQTLPGVACTLVAITRYSLGHQLRSFLSSVSSSVIRTTNARP